MKLRWLLPPLLVLMAATPALAIELRVTPIPQLSTQGVWRFEVVNNSVDTLRIEKLTAVFSAGGHRLWSQQVGIIPSQVRPGETAMVALDAAMVPRVRPLRIDWVLTWNPYDVPVLSRYWTRSRVASTEIAPPSLAARPERHGG